MDLSVLAIVNLLQLLPSRLLLYPSFTPPLLRWSPPHNGGVCPEMTTKDPLYYHPLAGGFLITFKGITLYLSMDKWQVTALYPLQRVEKERRVNKACDKLLLSVINVELEMQGTCSFSLAKMRIQRFNWQENIHQLLHCLEAVRYKI